MQTPMQFHAPRLTPELQARADRAAALVRQSQRRAAMSALAELETFFREMR